jgi:tyrosyl-tRNA synthetase
VTKLVHGEEKAVIAQNQARSAFGGAEEGLPTVEIERTDYIPDIMVACGAAKSKGDARKLIEGGGVSVGDKKLEKNQLTLDADVLKAGEFILHKGKKIHIKIILK